MNYNVIKINDNYEFSLGRCSGNNVIAKVLKGSNSIQTETIIKTEIEEVPVEYTPSLRFMFSGVNTNPEDLGTPGSWTKVEDGSVLNLWDWICDDSSWDNYFENKLTKDFDSNIKILIADTKYVESMEETFHGCTGLTAIPVFDTSYLTNVHSCFEGCSNLVTGMYSFYSELKDCIDSDNEYNYQDCFTDAGTSTSMGMAERCAIPISWGGEFDTNNLSSIVFEFTDTDYNPTTADRVIDGSWTQVSTLPNRWRWRSTSETEGSWSSAFNSTLTTSIIGNTKVKIISIDMTGITTVDSMFAFCTNLIEICEPTNSNQVGMADFQFEGCTDIEDGLYDFYIALKDNEDITHNLWCTDACTSTTNGQSDRALIPQNWGGDKSNY